MAQVCYRHPDRETGVSCSSCGRPICPDCMTSTAVGMRCPECAGERTQVIRPAAGGWAKVTPVVYALIAINVAVAAAGFLLDGSFTGTRLHIDGGLLADGRLSDGSMIGVAEGQWWRIITAGFLHHGLFHLAVNMFALYILGSLLEPALGSVRFAALYMASLLTGSLGALILDPNALTAGASGAIYGVFGATYLVARDRGLGDVAATIGFWLILNLLITFSVSSISVGGHLGGLAGGGLLAVLLMQLDRRLGPQRALVPGVAACVALGLIAFAASVAVA